MTISKNTPETLASGMEKQSTLAGARGAANMVGGSLPSPGQGVDAQAAEISQADIDPMQRLAQIVAQSQQIPMPEANTLTEKPVMPAELTARVIADSSIPQPFVAGERSVPLQTAVDAIDASESMNEMPLVDIVPPPAKKGFFSKKKAVPSSQNRHGQKNLPKTTREKRVARRRRRIWFEELLGWIFVPLILLGLYWAALGVMALVGTTPEALISGFKLIMSHFW